MHFFNKGLSTALVIGAVGIAVALSSCVKGQKYDYSYLDNLPAQAPEDITPLGVTDYRKALTGMPVRIEEIVPEVENTLDASSLEIWEKQKTLPIYAEQRKKEVLRVAMLLPLSGNSAETGKAMLNAAMMALSETNNERVILQFYDTKDSPEDAARAAVEAVNENADLILGPLFSEQVKSVANEIGGKGINIISFSSDPSVIGDGVYSVALLIPDQVHKVVSFACEQGYKNLAVLTQSNEMGEYAFAGAKAAIEDESCGGAIVQMGFYNPATTDFSDAVKNILPMALLIKMEKEKLRKQGYEVVEETLYDEDGNPIDENNITFDFDSILVVDEGAKLRSLGALLNYYDIDAEDFKILGVSAMDDPKVKKEKIFRNAWYTTLPKAGFNKFTRRYRKIFGVKENPPRIATLSYDVVSLAAFIADKLNNDEYISSLITSPAGFAGTDGIFRLLPDGRAERAMAVMQVKQRGSDTMILSPEKRFTSAPVQKVDRQTPELSPKKEETTVILEEIIATEANNDSQVEIVDGVFKIP